ncbi:MAG TPA: histidinol dehydrogenase, partial [Actinomycetota bacterium]
CTPPAQDGSVPDAVLYAARAGAIHEVFRIGGAQAIAAMAFGTETVPSVDTIAGPGNVWVTAAKREVMGTVGVDALAGPTELAIVADGTADPSVLAVDLVAQCEHDPMARTTLVALDPGLPAAIEVPLAAELEASPRGEGVRAALEHAVAVLAPDEEAAASVVDALAPEHLQVVTADPRAFLARVRSYGAAFLGPHTAVSLGDYGVGSNHVLPTMATARFASGLRAAHFVTVSSWTEASPEGAARFGPEVETVARAEGLGAHARASEVRR